MAEEECGIKILADVSKNRLHEIKNREGDFIFCEGEFPVITFLPLADFFKC